MSFYSYYEVTTDAVEIKFLDTLDASSIQNSSFTVTNDTLSTILTNPFQTINVIRDFYSISRTLVLYWDSDLEINTEYTISVSLKAVDGSPVTGSISFSTGASFSATPNMEALTPPDRDPVDVEDYSIKDISSFITALPSSDETSITATVLSPADNVAYYIDSSYAEGRIDIKFNQIPAANYVSSDYFKVQKKLVSRQLSRWEAVDALITADTVNNYIYIYLPSTDETPVYGEADKEYWEASYKYRVVISAGIGI